MNALQSWWARLPRDTRDSFFLLGVITAVMAPHAGHLPWWSTALTAIVLSWRAQLAWRQRPLPSRWWLVAIVALYASLTWLTFRTLVGREAGITLLVMLMALKTLELRARRDAFVLDSCREVGIPVAITIGGGYGRRIDDTVAAHLRTVRVARDRAGG